MAGEKNIVLKGAGENGSDITTRSIGGKISFYTDHRNFQVVSPKSKITSFPYEETLYVKNGSNYEKIESESDGEFSFESVRDNVGLNFYIEENTSQLTCPACNGRKQVQLGEDNNKKPYTCPCCNGTGEVVKATDVEIIGISAFFTKNSSVTPIIKYQVVPPGSITSTLIDAIDII